MIKLKKTRTIEQVINKIELHNLDSLKVENGELPDMLRTVIMYTKNRLYTGEFKNFLENEISKFRMYDLAMGYISYVNDVFNARNFMDESEENLDIVISKTIMANLLYAMLDCILDLENNNITGCNINGADIEFLLEETFLVKDLLKDQYDLILYTSELGCVLEDTLYFRDTLYYLITRGRFMKLPSGTKLDKCKKVINFGNLEMFENKSMVVINENGILSMNVVCENYYGMYTLILEVRTSENKIYDVIIPQSDNMNTVLTDNIKLYMTYLKRIIDGTLQFV